MEKIRIGILATGIAEGAKALIEASKSGELEAEIVFLISNLQNSSILKTASDLGIETLCLTPDLFGSREEYDARIASEFWKRNISLILLCNYTRILSMPILNTFKDRILSLHPSLIPSFSGKGMYGKQVFKNTIKRGVSITGCTIYVVDENVAEGKILGQIPVEISPNDNLETLQKKINECQKEFYPDIVNKYLKTLAPLDFSKKPYSLGGTNSSEGDESSFSSSSSTQVDYYDDRQKKFSFKAKNKQQFGICDVGLKRKENMDTILVTEDGKLLGVADGIGSAKGGKQASRMIMSMLQKKWLEEGSKANLKLKECGSWLRKVVIESNQELLQWNNNQVQKLDLGSTLIIGLIDYENNNLYISNTGDSRAYLWRSNTLYRLTRDHSEGYDPNSGEGGSLLYYIGGGKGAFGLDLFQLSLYSGDKILLCSDGLLYASEKTIAKRFTENYSIEELGETYLKDAYEAGAPDNTSIVLLFY